MKKYFNTIATAFTALLIIGALLYWQNYSKTPNRPPSGKITIAASIFPLSDIAKNIGRDKVEVITIIPSGASPHTFSPTPSLIKKLNNAKIVFTIGFSFDSWISEITSALPQVAVYPVHSGIKLKTWSDWQKTFPQRLTWKNNNDPTSIDPHYWLSPENGRQIAKNIYQQLIKLDPANKQYYYNNWLDFDNKLAKLNTELKQELKNIPNRNLIVFHDSWNYFAEAFGLNIIGVFTPNAGQEPSPQYLKSLYQLVNKYKIKVIFSEPQLSLSTLKPFLDDLNLKVYLLDPLGGDFPRDSYLNLLKYNALTIKKALSYE